MASEVKDAEVAAALDGADAALEELASALASWSPDGVVDAGRAIREGEVLSRRLHAVLVGVLSSVDRSGVYRADGHASAKVMVRHCGNLSNAEAWRRSQVASALADLPSVAAAHAEGRLGTAQAERIARVHANRRVREALVAEEAAISRAAVVLPYREFDDAIADWERLADEDGAGDRAERADANRDFRMPRNLDGSGRFEGGGGALAMQAIEDVWQRQVQCEFAADWADARCRLGDAATKDDLARTDGQRRFDAMRTCFLRGDLAEYGVEARTCTELVVDEVTFERRLAALFGADPGPDPRLDTWWDDLCSTLGDAHHGGAIDPTVVEGALAPDEEPEADAGAEAVVAASADAAAWVEPVDPVPPVDRVDASHAVDASRADGGARAGFGAEPDDGSGAAADEVPATAAAVLRPGSPGGLVGFRSSSIDGRPLDPTEVVVASLIGQVRRVVTGADGVVLDMGRRARLFTGARQLAVRLSNRSCVWTGCDVGASDCQSDHLDAFHGSDLGGTDPSNGAPQCGRHNRFKERGFTVVRDRHGRYHVYRPDGTEIT